MLHTQLINITKFLKISVRSVAMVISSVLFNISVPQCIHNVIQLTPLQYMMVTMELCFSKLLMCKAVHVWLSTGVSV